MLKQVMTQVYLGGLVVLLQELGERLALPDGCPVGHVRPGDRLTTNEGYRVLMKVRDGVSLAALDATDLALTIQRLGNLAERLETGEALSESRVLPGDWQIPQRAALCLLGLREGFCEVEPPQFPGFLPGMPLPASDFSGGLHAA